MPVVSPSASEAADRKVGLSKVKVATPVVPSRERVSDTSGTTGSGTPTMNSMYALGAETASGASGASALRQRALFIASTASAALLPSTSIGASIEALGATFIKFGQAAANRPDLVGPALADELRLLQDSCAPFSRDEVVQAIREDLSEEAAAEVLAALGLAADPVRLTAAQPQDPPQEPPLPWPRVVTLRRDAAPHRRPRC